MLFYAYSFLGIYFKLLENFADGLLMQAFLALNNYLILIILIYLQVTLLLDSLAEILLEAA